MVNAKKSAQMDGDGFTLNSIPINPVDHNFLHRFFLANKKRFIQSVSGYVYDRKELQLRNHVNLKTGGITPTIHSYINAYNQATTILDKYYFGFESAICLWYCRNRVGKAQNMMRFHSDHSAYARGAVMLNLTGRVNFQIKRDWKTVKSYTVEPGDVVEFDNKVPHAVDWHPEYDGQERMCIVLFHLKPQSKHKQLSLF